MRNLIFCIAGLLLSCHLFASNTLVFDYEIEPSILSVWNNCGTVDYCNDQILLSDPGSSVSVTINPNDKRQVIDGWGGSLCWWANIMGGYSDAKIKQLCNWITNPVSGLNMNIFRFNIGGGDSPDHHHMRADGGNMSGYKNSLTAAYNWKSDANQRRVLQQLIASRIANTGLNDIKIIGFSNSPPWWMTVSGCSAGSVDGTTTNLKADMFDGFADYLTDVTRYYHDSLGITFNNIEPFNEPYSTWWKAKGKQEGCYFTQNDQQIMLHKLHAKLQQKEMLSYCTISAMDANSIDEAYNGILGYKNAGDILPKISRIDVHSYAGAKRTELAALAAANNLNIWQSESGPLSVGGTDSHQMMTVCDRVITDFKELNCKAWIDWQLGSDGSPLWGLLVANYGNQFHPVSPGMSYYLRVQFSRYLKVGYRIIYNNSANVLTAISPNEKELVIVVSNAGLYAKKFNLDLSTFSGIGTATKVLTRSQVSFGSLNSSSIFTINEQKFTYDAFPESVCTFVIPINQPVQVK